jgi:hypothetical protein
VQYFPQVQTGPNRVRPSGPVHSGLDLGPVSMGPVRPLREPNPGPVGSVRSEPRSGSVRTEPWTVYQDVPVANVGDELEGYNKEVAKAICNDVSTDEVWETVNPFLDRLLGFGKSKEEIRLLLRRGEKGLRGLHGFLAYLVEEKGVGGPLLEGKINLLVETIEE